MRSFRRASFLVLVLSLLAACGQRPGDMRVEDAWARPAAAGGNAAVYFELRNTTSVDDVLVGASSEMARAVEMHQSMMLGADELDGMVAGGQGEHDMGGMAGEDVMQMSPVTELALPAGGEIVFEPGSYHVMLVDLREELAAGDRFTLTLHFEQAGDVVVEVEVGDR